MADMGGYTADKYTAMVKAITVDLGNTADKLALAQNILNGSAVIDDQHVCHLYDPDLSYG